MKTITGTFQYPDGSAVAGGKLILRLSQDAVALNTTQIAPRDVTITLNGSGAIPGATTIWANDELAPAGTFYIMSLIAPGGQLVWGGELFSLTGTSPLNLNTFQPVGSFTNPIYTNLPVFETNGAVNGSQSLLNLKNGAGITITDDGVGGVTITSGSAIALQHDGTPNSSQATLNLQSGAGVAISNPSAGNVRVDATGIGFGPRMNRLWALWGIAGGNTAINSTNCAGWCLGQNPGSTAGGFTNVWATATEAVLGQLALGSGTGNQSVYAVLDGASPTSLPIMTFGNKPLMQTRMIPSAGQVNRRYWVGFSSDNTSNASWKASLPAAMKIAAFRYDDSQDSGTVTWKATYSDGTNQTIVDTGVVVSFTASKLFQVAWDGTSFTYYIDNVIKATITPTTNPAPPSASTACVPFLECDNNIGGSSAAVAIQLNAVYVECL